MNMHEEWTWGDLLEQGAKILLDAGIEDCREDAKALFLECFGTDQAGFFCIVRIVPRKNNINSFFSGLLEEHRDVPYNT